MLVSRKAHGIFAVNQGGTASVFIRSSLTVFVRDGRFFCLWPVPAGGHAYARKLAPTMGKEQILVVTISGRGDKDCVSVARYRGEEISE